MKNWTFVILAFLYSSVPRAQDIYPETMEEAEKYSAEALRDYRQKTYQLNDPAGDYALLKRSQLVPAKIVKKLMGTHVEKVKDHSEDYEREHVPSGEAEPRPQQTLDEKMAAYCERNPQITAIFKQLDWSLGLSSETDMEKFIALLKNIDREIQGRENPLNREGFSNMFAEVINDERAKGIEPSYGTPHEWSPEFLEKYGKSSLLLSSSKLLMALAVGDTNRYMKTDKEGDFYRWLVQQKEESVDIADVFRASYRLNAGDVYKTLLTIENVLAHQWRNPERSSLPFVSRLKPITSGHEYSFDKFGTWYHLFGIMLYGYVEGGAKARVVGRIEALGSVMLSPMDKTQKAWMNKEGGVIGGDLGKMIKEKTFTNVKRDVDHLKPEYYLNRTEDFRDRIVVPKDKWIKATTETFEDRTNISVKNLKDRNLTDCRVELIPDTGRGLDARKIEVKENVNIDGATLTVSQANVRKVRGFIKCKGRDDTIVFESE